MVKEGEGLSRRRFRIGYKSLLSATGTFLSLLFLLLISLQAYYSARTLILNEINSINMNYLYQSKQKLDNNLMQIENIAQSLENSASFIDMLQKYRTGSSGERMTNQQDICRP